MPNPLHILGCDLIERQWDAGNGQLYVRDLGLTVVDRVLANDLLGRKTCYGSLLVANDNPHSVLVPTRGTKTGPEWASDLRARLRPSKFSPGKVEAGWGDIFDTFYLESGRPMAAAILSFAESVIFGHSLGGPLATYFAAATLASELVCYASPKPGDADFAAWVRSRVKVRTFYADAPDFIWKTPPTIQDPLDEFNFQHIDAPLVDPSRATPPIQMPINDPFGPHHITTYRELLAAA
jgi:hypothetical protein